LSRFTRLKLIKFLRSQCEINPRYLGVYFLIGSIPAVLVEKNSIASVSSTLSWFFVKASGVFSAYVVWKSFGRYFENRYKSKIYELIAIGAIGAALGGSVVHLLGALLNLESETSLGSRILGAAIVGAIWLPSISTANNSLNDFRMRVEDMTARLVSQDQIKFKQSILFEYLTSSFYRSIQKKLSVTSLEARDLFNSYLENSKNARELPEIVTKIATTTFRELSHSIQEDFASKPFLDENRLAPKTWKRVRNSIHLSTIVKKTPILDPFPYAFITGLFCAVYILRHSTLSDSLLTISIVFFSNLLLLRAHRYLCSIERVNPAIFIVSAITSTAVVPPLIVSLFTQVQFFNYQFKGTSFYSFSYFILALVISFLGYVAVLIRATIQEIEASLQNEYQVGADKELIVANEISRITTVAAKYIHGNLQSNLITLSKNLESAMQNQDAQKVDLLINQILEILRNPEVDLERKPNSIHLEISSKSALWGGLVEIHQNVSVAEDRIAPSLVNQISDCVEEAISNAVRHGKASVISIYLQEGTLGKLVLTVTDNGQLDSTPVGGFGFRIYQEASQGNWSVKRDKASDLTVLEVNFVS